MRNQLQFGIGPQVPSFRVQRIKRPKGLVKVTCTRCGNWFVVKYTVWVKASHYMTRSCPHCWKASTIHKHEETN